MDVHCLILIPLIFLSLLPQKYIRRCLYYLTTIKCIYYYICYSVKHLFERIWDGGGYPGSGGGRLGPPNFLPALEVKRATLS